MDWKVISGEREVEHIERKSGVDKWKTGASEGTMLLQIESTCMCISVCCTVYLEYRVAWEYNTV